MKLVKLLSFLEDPKHPSVGPHIRLLRLIGIWHPHDSLISRIKLSLVYLNLAFFISQYAKCLIKFDLDSLNLILQFAPFHMGVVKIALFQKDYKRWERLIAYISKAELIQLSQKDKILDGIIDGYVNWSRKLSYFLWGIAPFCNISIFAEPYMRNQINENGTSVYVYIFDGYTPFAREPPGYYCAMIIQTVFGNMMSAYIIVWDMLVVSIMIFFAGQLRTSMVYCERAVDLESMENSHQNIVQCHRFHIDLIRYQKEFNSLISPSMFLYLLVISINLGVQIIEITAITDIPKTEFSSVPEERPLWPPVDEYLLTDNYVNGVVYLIYLLPNSVMLISADPVFQKNDFGTLLSGCLFIMVSMFELLLFYWHTNEVTVQSELAGYSTFRSQWMEAELSVQKEIALLSLTMTKRMVFRAGPFNEMSLATFVAILRGSYSFYTLLNGTNN